MLICQDISYQHSNKEILFENISFHLPTSEKVALIGPNGIGKSSLLKLILGQLQAIQGQVVADQLMYYVPQIHSHYQDKTIAQALGISQKRSALHAILNGSIHTEHFATLNDDWDLEDRAIRALTSWSLSDISLDEKMGNLSGGEQTKVFLAGIDIHQPGIILLDEPSNHLDQPAREQLYHWIMSCKHTLLIVSHDRKLLNLMDTMYEMSPNGIRTYLGNYDSYCEQKSKELELIEKDILDTQKEIRKAQKVERKSIERKEREKSRAKKKQLKAGVPKVMRDKMKNDSQISRAKLADVHQAKMEGIQENLASLKAKKPVIEQMKLNLDDSKLHVGKLLISLEQVNYTYDQEPLWKENLSFQLYSGERICLSGSNGSGKTSLIKLLLGELDPSQGKVFRAPTKSLYIDQNYSLLDSNLSIYEQAQEFNSRAIAEHEIKILLDRFLFPKEVWMKPCAVLSGGERLRLILCCLSIMNQSPDLIILDEPTNNLDLINVSLLTDAIKNFNGSLIVVSHDVTFIDEINLNRKFDL